MAAFSGWNNTANAASDALLHLIGHYPLSELETIGARHYFDFQVTRPILRRSPGGPWIQWPHITLQRTRLPKRDLIIVIGPEPNWLWCSFSHELVQRLKRYESSVVLLLRAILNDTPYSRPLPITTYTCDSQLKSSLAIEELTYEGPTDITGVVNQILIAEGFPSASMWVSIPHYIAISPSPRGQHTLLSRMEQVLSASPGAGNLLSETSKWVQAVDELSAEGPDAVEYIGQLEEARDTSGVRDTTGGSVAAEFERYLRDRDNEPG